MTTLVVAVVLTATPFGNVTAGPDETEPMYLDSDLMRAQADDGSLLRLNEFTILRDEPGLLTLHFQNGESTDGVFVVAADWLRAKIGAVSASAPYERVEDAAGTTWLQFDAPSRTAVTLSLERFEPIPNAAGFGQGSMESVYLADRPMRIEVLEVSSRGIWFDFSADDPNGQRVAFQKEWVHSVLGTGSLAFEHETEGHLPVRILGDFYIVDPPHFSGIGLYLETVDTDGDGIMNYAETVRLRSNYTATDSDGDGVSDNLDIEPLYDTGLAIDIWNISGSALAVEEDLHVHVSVPRLNLGKTATLGAHNLSMHRFQAQIPDGIFNYRHEDDAPAGIANANATMWALDPHDYYLDIYVGVCRATAGTGQTLPLGNDSAPLQGAEKKVTGQWTHFFTTDHELGAEATRPLLCSQIMPGVVSGESIDYVIVRYDVLGGDWEVLRAADSPQNCVACHPGDPPSGQSRQFKGPQEPEQYEELPISIGCCRTLERKVWETGDTLEGMISDGMGTFRKALDEFQDDIGTTIPEFPCQDGCGYKVDPCDFVHDQADKDVCEARDSPIIPIDQDPDDDGLLTDDEPGSGLGTNALVADTDDDGWPDGFEKRLEEPQVAAFTDPTEWTCQKGLYELLSGRLSFKPFAGNLGNTSFVGYSADSEMRSRDTDEDGIPDGLEDLNFDGSSANPDGSLQPGETIPDAEDTDGDTLKDGRERLIFDAPSLASPSYCDVHIARANHEDAPHPFALDPVLKDSDSDDIFDFRDISPQGDDLTISVQPGDIDFHCDPESLGNIVDVYSYQRIAIGELNIQAEVRVPGGSDTIDVPYDGVTYLGQLLLGGVNIPQDVTTLAAESADNPGLLEVSVEILDADSGLRGDDDKIDVYGVDATGASAWTLSFNYDIAAASASASFPTDIDSQNVTGSGKDDARGCSSSDGYDATLDVEVTDTVKAWFFEQALAAQTGEGVVPNPSFQCLGTPNCNLEP